MWIVKDIIDSNTSVFCLFVFLYFGIVCLRKFVCVCVCQFVSVFVCVCM